MDYDQFYNYDWKVDSTYHEGLKIIYDRYFTTHDSITKEEKKSLILKAKSFYYKKQFGIAIDIPGYLDWLNEEGLQEDDEIWGREYNLSYDQLASLISEGKEIPGIEEIPKTVLDGEKSASVMSQRSKPWEA